MLKQFNSNAKKLNRILPKINFNNLSGSLSNAALNIDITGSLQNIEVPTTASFQSHTKSNPNSIKIVNNKNTINNFYQEILENSARKIKKQIDTFDSGSNTLTIYNTKLDYGTEGASPENFEIITYGLHIPGDFTIKEIENNIVITLGDNYIDFDSVTISDIYVIGKFK